MPKTKKKAKPAAKAAKRTAQPKPRRRVMADEPEVVETDHDEQQPVDAPDTDAEDTPTAPKTAKDRLEYLESEFKKLKTALVSHGIHF